MLLSPAVRWYSPYSSVAVLRCSRDQHQQCLQALSRLTYINYRPVSIKLLRLTGEALLNVVHYTWGGHGSNISYRPVAVKLLRLTGKDECLHVFRLACMAALPAPLLPPPPPPRLDITFPGRPLLAVRLNLACPPQP